MWEIAIGFMTGRVMMVLLDMPNFTVYYCAQT